MFQQTSLLAHRNLTKEKIGARQRQVAEALERLGTANNRMISKESNLPINVVTPRVRELREKGIVQQAYKAIDPVTKTLTIFWELTPEVEERESVDSY